MVSEFSKAVFFRIRAIENNNVELLRSFIMKFVIKNFILLYVFISVFMLWSAAASEKIITDQGKALYNIVISKEASVSEKYASQELKNFIRQISGAELSIVSESKATENNNIYVGAGKTALKLLDDYDISSLDDEGFLIKTCGSNLIIAGGKKRGTLYGVYTFLEDILGCHWYTPKVSKIPSSKTIKIRDIDIVQKPHFEYRDIYFKTDGADARDPDWAVRNKCNGGTAVLDDKRGGYIQYGAYGHTFYRLIPADEYMESHPEYFSLVKGERKGGNAEGQLCLSNPDVLDICKKNLLKWIDEKPEKNIFSVSINDNWKRCECDDCKALDAKGNSTDTVLGFVNSIADAVAQKHPHILIEMLAYYYTSNAPEFTSPRPNVRVKLSPWVCKLHPFSECKWDKIIASLKNIKKWNKLTDNLYIWEYTCAYSHLPLPNPDLRQFVDSTRVYRANGVKGIFVEGNDMSGNGGYMEELKIYLFAKALWNPDIDADAVIDDFMKGYFEASALPMKKWVMMLEDETKKRPNVHANVWPEVDYAEFTGHAVNKPRAYFPLIVPEMVVEADKLFDEAEALANSPEILKRVKHARMSLKYLKAMRKIECAGDYGTDKEKAVALEEFEKFIEECKQDGIKYFYLTKPIEKHVEEMKAPLKNSITSQKNIEWLR